MPSLAGPAVGCARSGPLCLKGPLGSPSVPDGATRTRGCRLQTPSAGETGRYNPETGDQRGAGDRATDGTGPSSSPMTL